MQLACLSTAVMGTTPCRAPTALQSRAPTNGSHAPARLQITCDKAKVVCVDSKLVDETIESLAGAQQGQK